MSLIVYLRVLCTLVRDERERETERERVRMNRVIVIPSGDLSSALVR